MNQVSSIFAALVSVLTAVVGLAIVAALVSRNANTAGVAQSILGGFASDISAADAPVSSGGGGFGSGIGSGMGMTPGL
jgi:hypothetical protein